jgi:glycosyltransferase involved in cell wall biosynthesis
MSPPRILFVNHASVLSGAELYLIDAVRAFRSTSHVVLFESGPLQKRLRDDNISVEVLPTPASFLNVETSDGWRSAVSAVPALLRLTLQLARRAREYDLLYANSQKAFLVAGLAGLLIRRPVIWNLHDVLTADHFSPLNRRVAVGWANLFADRVIVNSEATKSAFIQSGGSPEKTTIVYNGFDPTPFETVSEKEIQKVRRELGIQGVACVGVFSRLAPWKGQHVLLDTLAEVPDVHALIVGDALFEDGASYARSLREQAKRLGLMDRVHFLGFRSDIPVLMKAVDAVVHTSTAPEPFGRVIVEGLLAGRPVIATKAGGADEILDDPETGWLVPSGDATALADTLRAAVNESNAFHAHPGDDVSPCKRAERGSKMARRRFSVERMRSSLQKHVNRVIR